MSGRNVELHRRVIEAFNARDIEWLIALCDPGVEWNSDELNSPPRAHAS
jgi:hypothetical protein